VTYIIDYHFNIYNFEFLNILALAHMFKIICTKSNLLPYAGGSYFFALPKKVTKKR